MILSITMFILGSHFRKELGKWTYYCRFRYVRNLWTRLFFHPTPPKATNLSLPFAIWTFWYYLICVWPTQYELAYCGFQKHCREGRRVVANYNHRHYNDNNYASNLCDMQNFSWMWQGRAPGKACILSFVFFSHSSACAGSLLLSEPKAVHPVFTSRLLVSTRRQRCLEAQQQSSCA